MTYSIRPFAPTDAGYRILATLCGFRLAMRSPRASLDLTEFDPTRTRPLRQQLAKQAIQIYTLAELYEREPNWKPKLYELRWALIQDVPAVEPPTRPTLAEFEQMILADPALDAEAWFVAVDENDAPAARGPFVGMSNLWLNDPARERLDTGLTGVRRAYRRRGIATALKVQTILFARSIGARTIDTSNEEDNPIYSLNLRLGFRPKAAHLSYRKRFS